MARYIFSMGLVPVQEYISEARRSRDLRAGSATLSFLTSQMLIRLEDALSATLLIPAAASLGAFRGKTIEQVFDDAAYSIPNRATGICEANSIKEVKNFFAEELSSVLCSSWEALYTKCFAGVPPFLPTCITDEEKKALMESFRTAPRCPIDLIWVAKSISTPSVSSSDISEIGKAYTDVKRTRPISVWQGGKMINKCNQCGKREIISPVDDFRKSWEWQKRLDKTTWVVTKARIATGERLCLVCLMKRYAGYLGASGASFPSTSEIASSVWRARIESTPSINVLLQKLQREQEFLSRLGLEDPEVLYYRSSVRSFLTSDELPPEIKKALEKYQKLLDDFASEVRKSERQIKPEPSKYLAVLMFDGDDMGKKVARDYAKLTEKLHEFSQALLRKYSSGSAKIFYVGGDEGLMLTPIETALQVATDIRKTFRDTFGEEATLSMGISIFDRQRPLGGAIEIARRSLEKSKAVDGKNALTLSIQTASGNEFGCTAQWGEMWARLENAMQLIMSPDESRRLSMGWAYDLEAFLQTLPEERLPEVNFQSAVRAEMKRLTFRRLRIVNPASLDDLRSQKSATWESELLGPTWLDVIHHAGSVESISNQLHALAFLCRESSFETEDVEEPQIEGGEE